GHVGDEPSTVPVLRFERDPQRHELRAVRVLDRQAPKAHLLAATERDAVTGRRLSKTRRVARIADAVGVDYVDGEADVRVERRDRTGRTREGEPGTRA